MYMRLSIDPFHNLRLSKETYLVKRKPKKTHTHTSLFYIIVNDKIGFGAINLSALIIAARTWTHVPEKHTCVTELNEGLIRYELHALKRILNFKENLRISKGTRLELRRQTVSLR